MCDPLPPKKPTFPKASIIDGEVGGGGQTKHIRQKTTTLHKKITEKKHGLTLKENWSKNHIYSEVWMAWCQKTPIMLHLL